MSLIASWNVRGLNWPNKQEDVKLFLQQNDIGMVGLIETKIRQQNADAIASTFLRGWQWTHNCDISNGRIWVAWKPSSYHLSIMERSDQYIHCLATQLTTNKRFHITFVYGHNHEPQRQPLWNALHQLSLSITGAWSILGDFNTILSKNERIGGNEVTDHEIQELSNFMLNCEVQELTSSGAFFTWTNKTIWSKLDRVFINNLWYETFDFTIARVIPPGLSDHSPIIMQFHSPPRPSSQFQYCDMWSSHREFLSIVSSNLPDISSHDIFRVSRAYFSQVRRQLSHLHRDHFRDLKIQQEIARNALLQHQRSLHCSPNNTALQQLENEARCKYVNILSSSLALLRQQCKMEWIRYGDDSTRFFFAKAKQRKLSTYIYSLLDASGNEVEGFDLVGDAIYSFYRNHLGQASMRRTHIEPDTIAQGAILSMEQQLDLCQPFSDKDIKEAMFDIPNHKSPGPDGFSSGFFKSSWSTTGPIAVSYTHLTLPTKRIV